MACLLLVGILKADEEKVPLDKLPKAVLDAVKARYPGAELTGAEKEEGGKMVYEVALKAKGQKIEVTLTPEGKIVEIERQIAAKDMPKAVTDALQAKYPKATYKVVEEVIKGNGKEEKVDYYEVLLVTAGKDKLEVSVAPEGKILKEEKKGKADKDKD